LLNELTAQIPSGQARSLSVSQGMLYFLRPLTRIHQLTTSHITM